MELDWKTPIRGPFEGAGWIDSVVPHYTKVLELAEEMRGDPLGANDWSRAVTILDAQPEPTTPEQANGRWVEFVAAVKQGIVKFRNRNRKREDSTMSRMSKSIWTSVLVVGLVLGMRVLPSFAGGETCDKFKGYAVSQLEDICGRHNAYDPPAPTCICDCRQDQGVHGGLVCPDLTCPAPVCEFNQDSFLAGLDELATCEYPVPFAEPEWIDVLRNNKPYLLDEAECTALGRHFKIRISRSRLTVACLPR